MFTVEELHNGEHWGINRKSDNHCGSESLVVKQLNPNTNGFEYGWISSEGVVGEYQCLKFKSEDEARAFMEAKCPVATDPDRYKIDIRYFQSPATGELIDVQSDDLSAELFPAWIETSRAFGNSRYSNYVYDRQTAEQMLHDAGLEFPNLQFEIKEIRTHGDAYVAKGRGSAQFVRIPLHEWSEDGWVNQRKFAAMNLRKRMKLAQAIPAYMDPDSTEAPIDHHYRGFRFN